MSIARALLKDAPILVLDEALSSVDAESESTIQQALERLQRGRTTLVIAHRLSSVATADRIIVLERGRLVEEGAPSELMTRSNGVYQRLMAAQQTVVVDDDPAIAVELDASPPLAAARRRANSPPGVRPRPPRAGGAGRHASPPPNAGNPHHPLSRGVRAPLQAGLVWGRLFELVRPWWWETVSVFALGPLHAVSQVALGVVSAVLVGQVATGGNLTPWLWALAALVPATAVLRWLDSFVSHDLAYRLLAELRIRLYQLLDPLAPAYLVRRRSGDLVSALLGDVELIELFYAHTISPLFVAILVPAVC